MSTTRTRSLLDKINRSFSALEHQSQAVATLDYDVLREQIRQLYEAVADEFAPGTKTSAAGRAADASAKPALHTQPASADNSAYAAGAASVTTAAATTVRTNGLGGANLIFEVPEDVEAEVRQIEQERQQAAARARQASNQAAREEAARAQTAREEAAREEAAHQEAARDHAAREAHKARAQRDQELREQAALEELARQQAAHEQAARQREADLQVAREREALQQAAQQRLAAEQLAREQAEQDQAALRLAVQQLAAREEAARAEAARQPSPSPLAEATAHPLQPATASAAATVTTAAEEPQVELKGAYKELFTIERAADLSDRLANSPITDLSRAMSLNDQLLVKKELFGGSQELMNSTILRLNGLSSYEQAVRVLAEPAQQFDWVEEERRPTARTFVKLVRRRYA